MMPEAPPVESPPAVERTPEPITESSAAATSGSIWEVFGVPRPSEAPRSTADIPEPEVAVEAVLPLKPTRPTNDIAPGGLRLALRRRLVRVRRD
jgi:hypothetical protein